MRVCDMGIGNARVTIGLRDRDYEIYGVDFSPKQLKLARKKLSQYGVNAHLYLEDFSKTLPFEGQFLDGVISNAAFHHVQDKRALFDEVYRVMRPESDFIFFDFYFDIMEKKYISFVKQLRKMHPRTAKKFLESIKQEGNLMPAHLRANHPEEYHVHPRELCNLLEKSNFKDITLVPTYYDKYLGISCKK